MPWVRLGQEAGSTARMTGPGAGRELLAQEREGQPTEVRAATGAADDEVGALADLRELEQGLLADDRLVQQHVVEHRAQRVVDGGVLGRHLDGLADGQAQRAGGVGVAGEHRAARLGEVGGARVHGAAEDLHHDLAVRLGVVGRPHLPDLALEVELGAGERQRGAPLPGPGLGRQLPDAGLRVVVRLRHRGVRLVRPGGGDALVLVVDAGRGAERLLEAVRAVEGRRAATACRRPAPPAGCRRTARW